MKWTVVKLGVNLATDLALGKGTVFFASVSTTEPKDICKRKGRGKTRSDLPVLWESKCHVDAAHACVCPWFVLN